MSISSPFWKKAESTFYLITYTYNRIQSTLKWAAAIFIIAIGLSVTQLVEYEYQHRLEMVIREESNLLLAFEENVRRDLSGADEILRELKQQYEISGRSSRALLEHVQKNHSLPLVYVSMANARGVIENSTAPELVSMDISSSEYFQYFRSVDDKGVFYAKPVVGRKMQQWIFHISRRLNNADGSFGGTATVGFDPSYFAEFYQKMQLGNGFAVTIVGLDGVIRVRQTAEKMDVGTDIRNARFFSMLDKQATGSYIDVSTLDKMNRIYTYRAMKEYPFVLVIALLEQEAFADFYRLRERYWVIAFLGSLFVLGFFGLLIRLVGLRNETEGNLRQMNEQLAAKVAQRTEELEEANKELQIIAMMDGLTGIANRRYFDEYYNRLWGAAMRHGTHISIIMVDIDWFKAYNDLYGHQAGDDCLKQVAYTLRAATKRAADFVARYGGEEFVVILPDTDGDGAVRLAERLRTQVEALDIVHEKSQFARVTISLGVADTVPKEGKSPLDLIAAADKALYDAKNSGRNCVRRTGVGSEKQ